jgi:hypothetical protein
METHNDLQIFTACSKTAVHLKQKSGIAVEKSYHSYWPHVVPLEE